MASHREPSDGEVLAAVATDPEAFRVIYRRHERTVLVYLAARTRDSEATMELAAETFATALIKADRFRDEGQPAIGWLLGIARHAWLRRLERGQRDVALLRRLGIDRLDFGEESLARVEEIIDAHGQGDRLLELIDELPADQRNAVRAHVLDERSYAELAAEFAVSEATVRQRVSRGLARLRSSIRQELA